MKNCFVVLGDYQKFSSLVEELKEKYNVSEFDIKIYNAEQTDINKIFNEFSFQPVISERSIFIIKNVEKFSKNDCEKLYSLIKNISPNIIVILYGISINPPFKESSLKKKEEFLSPENMFFGRIYSFKNKNSPKMFGILKDYMKIKEKNFTLLISGIEIYLRNILKKNKELSLEIIEKFEKLYDLDFFLKVGKVEIGPELELYLLYYFFSTSS